MIPELQSPIPTAKAASAFLSVWMLLARRKKKKKKNSEGKENWRNVKIQRTITWRAEVQGKWRFSRTLSMLETSDQNGTVDNDILIVLYPYFIFCNFKRLS